MDDRRKTQLYFHIGDPKTGTTSIQAALYLRAWTCDTRRLEYPDHRSDVRFAKSLYLPTRRNQRAEQFKIKADWLAEMDADAAVISAEHFTHVPPDVMQQALTEFLPDHAATARFVAYVRPHAQRILSAYAQRLKRGTFMGDLDKFQTMLQDGGFYLYGPRFAGWRTMFGTRFILRPMLRHRLLQSDVVADFMNIVLEGAPFTLTPIPVANEALNVQQLACAREVQVVLRKEGIASGIREAVGGQFANLLNAMGGGGGEKVRMHRSLVERIRTHYLADARALDAMFFEGQPMEGAFDEAMAAASEVPFAHEMQAYADAASQNTLHELARQLAQALPDHGVAWRRLRLEASGQKTLGTADDPATLRGVARINTCLDALCGFASSLFPADRAA